MTVSEVGLALLPAEVCKSPAAIVLVAAPAVELVTLTITVQPAAGIDVAFAIVKLDAPSAAVTPVHVPVLPPVVMVIPVGRVSVRALVSVIALALVLPIVTVRLVFPPLAKLVAVKSFVMVGAMRALTVKSSLAVVPVSATGPVAVTVPVVLVIFPGVLLVTFTTT